MTAEFAAAEAEAETSTMVEIDLNSNSEIDSSLKMSEEPRPTPIESGTLDSMISVKNGCKSYGRHVVLDNLNINVDQGTIYALLGASGCGKTTLLSCLVGIKTMSSGSIMVCGEDLESIKIRNGGLRQSVGYMPQELALYKEFTILEALLYFGRIFGMSRKSILKRAEFLVEFLHLPHWNSEIRQMSGGQQRRTSFAVALIHSPKLLILDEPTVGVDPLLRKSIWEHLSKLVSSRSTTVIITTHYIEEASSAHTVGLMRNGRILAEGSPPALLALHHCVNLEHLFLTLSELDESKIESSAAVPVVVDVDEAQTHAPSPVVKIQTPGKSTTPTRIGRFRSTFLPYPGYLNRLHALNSKNFIYLWRQLLFIFFLLMFPAIQIVLCCWALGSEPWGLTFGVVNQESSVCQSPVIARAHGNTTTAPSCKLLSCTYVEMLGQLSTFKLLHFSSEETALDKMKLGGTYGYLVIPENFTTNVAEKSKLGARADHRIVQGAQVRVQMDMTSRHISISIQRSLQESYIGLMRRRLVECEKNPAPEIADGGINVRFLINILCLVECVEMH